MAEGKNSKILVKTSLGNYQEYLNNSIITVKNSDPMSLKVTFADVYGNVINDLSNDVSISNAILKGNDMEPINLVVTKPNTQELGLETAVDDIYQFNHLVQSDGYSLDFNVLTPERSTPFHYNIKITSTKDDTGYGNGPYSVAKSTLDKTSISMYAGDTKSINLLIKTAKGLLYNDNINLITDIKYELAQEDPSFTFEIITSNNYANYTILIFSTKAMENTLTISIKEKSSEKFTPLPSISLTIKPSLVPSPENTVIVSIPGETISPDEKVSIKFKLVDNYENIFTGNEEAKENLAVFHNGNKVSNPTIILEPDQTTYTITYIPTYPPRNCEITINYNYGAKQVKIFPEDIKTTILSEPYFMNTDFTSSNAGEMVAGSTLDLEANLYDKQHICADKEYEEGQMPLKVKVTGPIEDLEQQKVYEYIFKKKIDTEKECQNSYAIVVPEEEKYTKTGTYTIIISDSQNEIKRYTQTVVPDEYDISKFKVVFGDPELNPKNIQAGQHIVLNFTGHDKYDNQRFTEFGPDFSVRCVQNEKVIDESLCKFTIIENIEGHVVANGTVYATGLFELQYEYKDQIITTIDKSEGPETLMIVPGPCSTKYPSIDWSLINALTNPGEPTSFTIKCYDEYNNEISVGGEEFVVVTNLLIGEASTSVKSSINDKNNGEYVVSLTPPLAGEYTINITLGVKDYGEGKVFELVAGSTKCEGDTPITCPNNEKKCVASIIDCIEPPNDCPPETPFKCLVNNIDTCVSSMIKCDPPEGYVKCDYMNYCVPKELEDVMCPFSIPVNCKKYKGFTALCDDGICRKSTDLTPSQRVCPIGYVLCADLTCQTDYSKCLTYPECRADQIRCVDQSCASDNAGCPNTITCSKVGQVVCPDGSCVDSELECNALPKCADPTPFLCGNNACASSASECSKSVTCGHTLALCSDMICREEC